MRFFLIILAALMVFSCIGSADWYYRRAMGEFNQGHIDKALEYFTKALDQNPNHGESLYGLGWIYNLKGKRDQAFIFFRRCEAADPNYYGCYKGIASSYLSIGMKDKAQEALTIALNLSPENPSVLSNLADIEFSRGNYRQAIDLYQRAIEGDSHRGELFYGIGLTYIKLGEDDQALSYLDQGLRARTHEKRFKVEMNYLILTIFLRKISNLVEPYKYQTISNLNPQTRKTLKRYLRKARFSINQIRSLDPVRKGLVYHQKNLDEIETKYL